MKLTRTNWLIVLTISPELFDIAVSSINRVIPGDHSDLEPPDPIPNSEVKRISANDSVGLPHAKVGHRQDFFILKDVYKQRSGVLSAVDSIQGQWYLVQCKPRESFRAELNLNNQGYNCFHPTYPVKQKIFGSIKSIIAPLFPHYLFILLNEYSNWMPIRSTRGVNRIVFFNTGPAVLNNDVIDVLKYHCSKLNGKAAECLFKPGDRVRITAGCFKEVEAIVTASTSAERITLLIKLFNDRPQLIEVPEYAMARL